MLVMGRICLIAAAAGLLIGCGGGSSLYTVTGEVTYRGEPVSDGQILFADAAGKAATAYAVVADGAYSIEATAGAKIVRITATKETGTMIEGAMGATYPETIDLIPAEFNSASTLRVTVDPAQSLVNDFHLP